MRIRSIKPEFWRSGTLKPHDRQSFKEFGTAPPQREFAYRLYSRFGDLLYVGVTWSPFVRWTEHSKTKPWWPDVARAEVYLCNSDRDARDIEALWIRTEQPVHNKHQNPRWHRAAH